MRGMLFSTCVIDRTPDFSSRLHLRRQAESFSSQDTPPCLEYVLHRFKIFLFLTIGQIAVSTTKYLVELRGWNGIALPAVHSRDAKIYIDDPGPWIMGLATEARYSVRPAPEVCVCDL
jgi:hypothetical protein